VDYESPAKDFGMAKRMAKIKSCGFLIFKEDPSPSFLLMRHTSRWDLPKGHVDGDEKNRECALRELEEETGITENDIDIDEEFKFKHKYYVKNKRTNGESKKKKLIIYLARLINPVEIIPTEHESFEWMPWNPPHKIQEKTIDPLLNAVNEHWTQQKDVA
jgi:8-oxo-dGTP pyrophosphatase MutT (NUDIX family)